jgi:AcrR family transcriptional regulator
MPRPRTATDVDILQGAIRAISRVGPARLTLTEVGREVGLSPATLLQRFGSKRGLLLALAQYAATSIDDCFLEARRSASSPLGALMVAATEMAKHVESPEALANHLAFLQIDLSDPAFHTLALSGAEQTLAGYEALLREAIATGELAPCDVGALARAIQAMTGGSMINWAIHRDGRLIDWLLADLDVLVGPHKRAGVATVPARRQGPRARHRPPAS